MELEDDPEDNSEILLSVDDSSINNSDEVENSSRILYLIYYILL